MDFIDNIDQPGTVFASISTYSSLAVTRFAALVLRLREI